MNWTAIKSTFTCIALVAVSFLALTVAHDEHVTSKHANEVLMQAGDAEAQVTITLKKINAPGGLLQVTGKAVAKADNVLGHADILVSNEQDALKSWNKQITDTLGNVNIAVAAATSNENEITKGSVETLNATTDALKALSPVEQKLTTEIDALHTATVDITAMLPDVQATTKSVRGITLNLEASTGDFGRVTKKFADDYTKKVAWYMWPLKQYNDLMDLGAAAARFSR